MPDHDPLNVFVSSVRKQLEEERLAVLKGAPESAPLDAHHGGKHHAV